MDMSGQLVVYGRGYTYHFALGEAAVFSDFQCANERGFGRASVHPAVSQVFLFIDDSAMPRVEARRGKQAVLDQDWRSLVAADTIDLFTVDQGALQQTYRCEDWRQTQCRQVKDVWLLCGARTPRWGVTDYFAGNISLAQLFFDTQNVSAVQDVIRYLM